MRSRPRRSNSLRHFRPRLESLENRTTPASFQPLGNLPGGSGAKPFGISGDGTTVVGYGGSSLGEQAWRWTASDGMAGLGDLPGGDFESKSFGTSADGSVIVGNGRPQSNYYQAFRWTNANGLVSLGQLSTQVGDSVAYSSSADGSIVVGYGYSSGRQAFRWTTASGMVALGDFPGGIVDSRAFGTSADGSVVVGFGNSALGQEAFRWSAADGMVSLGVLPGNTHESAANAVSANGSVVVGYSYSTLGNEAFRWTSASGIVGLGDLSGGSYASSALGVSSDGSVVVGYANDTSGQVAYRWTAADGMRRLDDVLSTDDGIGSQLAGWNLLSAQACSADGLTIVGFASHAGTGTVPFIARLDPPPLGGTVNGTVYLDLDNNGQLGSGDSLESGATVFLDRNGSGILDAGETNVVTGIDGKYSLTATVNNQIAVREIPPNGHVEATLNPVTVAFNGGNSLSLDFGNVIPPPPGGTVEGKVYFDPNANNQRDSGEPVEVNVTVFLDANSNGQLDASEISTATAADGSFSLTTSVSGNYSVLDIPPNGQTPSLSTPSSVGLSGGNVQTLSIGNRSIAPLVAFAAGADAGGSPYVVAYDSNHNPLFGFYAYEWTFHGGVRVVTADINGDGVPDIITAPGKGGGPHIKVFSGIDGRLLSQFFAYAPDMTSGVFVGAGDVSADGHNDIITGAGTGSESRVRVFSGVSLNDGPIRDFVAYPGFNVGVTVAAGDFNNDGKTDIVTGPEAGNPHVKVFDGDDPTKQLFQFFAYDPRFPVGVFVAACDLNNDGKPDIVTGAGSGGGPHVRVFSGATLALLNEFFAYDPAFHGGVRVSALNMFNSTQIFLAPGLTTLNPPGNSNMLRDFISLYGFFGDFSPFGDFVGGAYVG
ncbi:MAG: FG-GAP-like repeat-containing protein [Gemmataceae bacterium]